MNSFKAKLLNMGLVIAGVVAINGSAEAQSISSSFGPVCAVEYAQQNPYSSTAPALRIYIPVTGTDCNTAQVRYVVSPSTSSGQAQCAGTSYANYPMDIFNSLYQNAVNAQIARSWISVSGGGCGTSGGVLTCCVSSSVTFKAAP